MTAGVYLHIPFCKSRCSYCDFATDVYRNSNAVERYINALCREINHFVGRDVSTNETRVDSIYLGGGTPSLLTSFQVEQILLAVKSRFSVVSASEITMEMNPATVSARSLQAYRSLGINRASFGVQTFDDIELKRLARGHNAQDARDTFQMLREAGFENISFDLIAGLPRQTLGDWERNLDEALRMLPEHLSLYLLEIHDSTPLGEQIRSGRQPWPEEDLAAEMYEMMLDKTASAGYRQYEISNFAKPGFEARHNSKYWLLEPVYGFGVSAHSFDGHHRYANERDTSAYVRLIEKLTSAEVTREEIDAPSEFAFLRLRLNQGIRILEYEDRFGKNIIDIYRDDLDRLREADLIQISDGRLILTRRGRLFSNEVFATFI